MIPNRKHLQKVLAILYHGVTTNNPSVLDPDQAQLVKDLLEVPGGETYDRPARPFFRKTMHHDPDPKERLNNCRNCAFWCDPGRLSSFGACYRLALAYNDLLTPIEDVVPGEPIDRFFTPEDFSCTWFLPREGAVPVDLGLNSERTSRLNQALDEFYGISKFLDLDAPSTGEEDGQ